MMNTDFYDYALPSEQIAIHPPKQRGTTRLLLISRTAKKISDSLYANLSDHLSPGTVVVINNTKVIPARLKVYQGNKELELILLENHSHRDWLESKTMKVLYRGKLAVGMELSLEISEDIKLAQLLVKEILGNGVAIIEANQTWKKIAEKYGTVPIPPYLKREEEGSDRERYQTIVAETKGSVAAPTASLNLTKELLAKLKAKGCEIHYLTLHVGLGTFLPIRVEDLTKHKMHSEYFEIPLETIEAIRTAKAENRPVLAIGTTVTRTLEYSAEQILNQSNETVTSLAGEADIFIYPSYKFQIVDQLLTNFHAPRSTVLMMAAAFTGWPLLKEAYEQAIKNQYQLLSYGDSMLIT